MLKIPAATRTAASILSILLALQAPGAAMALNIARIVPLSTGVSAPIVLPSNLILPNSALSPLQVYSLSPMTMAPMTITNPITSVETVAMGMTHEVTKAIQELGSVSRASSGDVRSFGGKIQDILTGETGHGLTSARDVAVGGANAGSTQQNTPRKPPTSVQKLMLQTLFQVASIYMNHYAPIAWKQTQMGVDLKKEYQQAHDKILGKSDITNRQFQVIMADFVAATRDYHASIQFASTERATLPVTIVKAEGKYYLGYINRKALPRLKFPFRVGDEVVEFGGKPVEQAVNDLNSVPNRAQTDARLSERRLTARSRRSGMEVPQGDIVLTIKGADGAAKDAALTWKYTAEAVPLDIPVRDGGLDTESTPGHVPTIESNFKDAFRKVLRKIIPNMAHPRAEEFKAVAKDNADNGFTIGGKNSFVPALGKIIWQLPPKMADQIPFKAYIYQNEQGQNIGYIRVSDFSGDEQAAMLFAQLIAAFEKKTDGLVFDQVNNPGGNLLFMYALLSMLTDKPLVVPKHRLIVDENDALQAAAILQQLADSGSHEAEESVLGEDMAGMGNNPKETMADVSRYAQFILDELKAGRRLTDATALLGIEKIAPNTRVRYTKPLVVLVNELDFSCADFLPAILQDNKRATIFGVNTSGSGGSVKGVELLNQQVITSVNYTWTFAQRPGGQPIENLGITPDVAYEITAADLRTNFNGYAAALNAVLAKLMPGRVRRSSRSAEDDDHLPDDKIKKAQRRRK